MNALYDRIYLLSHMRAFSSLTGHILGSHPDINGYYEMHISYQQKDDLVLQEQLYSQQETFKPDSHFLFDKLLHNQYELNLNNLNLQNPRLLISLRSAKPGIKSIVNLFQQKKDKHRYADPQQATQYYIQRLQKLSEFCRDHPQTYYYFDAELIKNNTQDMLSTLSNWLDLKTALNEKYQLFSQTGKPRAGDSSNAIKSGNIVKKASNYEHINIPDKLLRTANSAYQKYRDQILKLSIADKTSYQLCTKSDLPGNSFP